MKPCLVLLLGVTLLLSLAACNAVSNQLPQDFNLYQSWNTGALPPQYVYTYSINIDTQGTGEFVYHPGYEADTADDWHTNFSLSSQQMDDLYQYLLEHDLMRSVWEEGQPLIGGKGTSLQITAGGEIFEVPSVSELTQADRETVNDAIDYINGLVSQDIWGEMEARQKIYEEEFED